MFQDRYAGGVARRVVVADPRVQQIERKDGRRSWTIVRPKDSLHAEADRFLRLHDGSGTQKTYAYRLVDHLRWPEREFLAFGKAVLRDLERDMGIVGAEVPTPLRWRRKREQWRLPPRAPRRRRRPPPPLRRADCPRDRRPGAGPGRTRPHGRRPPSRSSCASPGTTSTECGRPPSAPPAPRTRANVTRTAASPTSKPASASLPARPRHNRSSRHPGKSSHTGHRTRHRPAAHTPISYEGALMPRPMQSFLHGSSISIISDGRP